MRDDKNILVLGRVALLRIPKMDLMKVDSIKVDLVKAILTCFITVLLTILLNVLTVLPTHATASSLSLTVDNISLEMDPSIDGTFVTSDTTTNNVSVTTTNGSGYTLSLSAKTANNYDLVYDANNKLTPISSNPTDHISAATFESSTAYNNKWGIRPSKYNSTNNTDYYPLSNATIVMDETSAANPSTANNYNLAVGIRATSAKAPGDYTNTITVTAIANKTNYSITYNNPSGAASGMPASTSSSTYDETVAISSTSPTSPTRSGYNFMGWCTNSVADGAACTGTTYAPGANWTLDQTAASNSLTLYAMWKAAPLYDRVKAMSKGTQTLDNLRAAITTANSGVYEYNSSVFGTSSDASNDKKIYYYRGILDRTTGSYGSDGDNEAYPNTVVLSSASSKAGLTTSDTCWRIVRTTGSGGVKMIYQGKWTGSTCANAQTNAQVATSAYNGTFSTHQQIVRVGYTHNSAYAVNTDNTAASISAVMGSNSNYGVNDTDSTIKDYIEDTWFSNINSYSSKLESSAGYCNDRTMNTGNTWTTPLPEDTEIVTYGTSGLTEYYFGANPRNMTSSGKPTLNCPRNTVDLYTTSSANNGNKQLSKPAALLTTDEAVFAGSGWNSSTTPYHANSFLRSGSFFWLLSPDYRRPGGYAFEFALNSNGSFNNDYVSYTYGVRPVISLTSDTTPAFGSGTATNPWVVNP